VVAVAAERERRRSLEMAFNRIPKREALPLVKVAAKEWLQTKANLASGSVHGYKYRVAPIMEKFGHRLICDLTLQDVFAYQRQRIALGKSPRTVNYEVGCLRGILKMYGLWATLADNMKSLKQDNNVGRAISVEDEQKLLKAALASRSPSLFPLIILSIDTGLRASEVRSLKLSDLRLEWKNGVITEGQLIVPKSKTEAGKGRVVPFTKRVCDVLTIWLARFDDKMHDPYVFPKHKIGNPKEHGAATMYEIDRSCPMGEWKTAWKRVCQDAEVTYRWHDLRHTLISRLAENPLISEETIRSLAGHVSREMLARYSHIQISAKKHAIATLEQHNSQPEPALASNKRQ
jgi:integrase